MNNKKTAAYLTWSWFARHLCVSDTPATPPPSAGVPPEMQGKQNKYMWISRRERGGEVEVDDSSICQVSLCFPSIWPQSGWLLLRCLSASPSHHHATPRFVVIVFTDTAFRAADRIACWGRSHSHRSHCLLGESHLTLIASSTFSPLTMCNNDNILFFNIT